MIKLEEVDLSKIRECEHPDIQERTYYLGRVDGRWHAGMFTRQWYGLNFNAVYPAGMQLAYRHSYGERTDFKELYKIITNS